MTLAAIRPHDMWVLGHAGFSPITAQTLVEYSGLLGSVSARISATIDRLEAHIGQGNAKYLFIGVLAILLLILFRRRR